MPPLTLENAGALVSGGVHPSAIEEEKRSMQQQTKVALPTTRKVRVVRSFYYQGKVLEKGTEHVLPYLFAREMEAASKAVPVVDEPKAAPAAPAAEATQEKKPARKEK